jgi:hypothetical protein
LFNRPNFSVGLPITQVVMVVLAVEVSSRLKMKMSPSYWKWPASTV